jgi:hypothetical protein
MRCTRLLIACLALLLPLFSSGLLFAQDTADMTFIGVGGENGGGFYTYPYYFNITGGPQPGDNQALICDSFDNSVSAPQSWTANIWSLLTAGTPGEGYYSGVSGLQASAQVLYDAAGMIFEAILTGGVSSVQGNWAIWGLFSANARGNAFYTSSGANATEAYYLNIIEADIANSKPLPAYLANLIVYTPVAGAVGEGNGPQEFIGVTPEPVSLALFGSGLGLLAMAIRRRRRSNKSTF